MLIYILISAAITINLGRYLFHHGKSYIDHFCSDHRLADQINRSLLLGFYLVNLGYVLVSILLVSEKSWVCWQLPVMIHQLGLIFLILGALHVCNLIGIQLLIHRSFHIKNHKS